MKVAGLKGHTVDAVDHDALARIAKREGRVAQQGIFQFVDGFVGADARLAGGADEFTLSQTQRIAQGIGLTLGIAGEGIFHKPLVDGTVVTGIHRAGCAEHSCCRPAGGVKGVAPEVTDGLVVRCDFAGGKYPYRTGLAAVGGHLLLVDEEAVRQTVGRAVAVVVEDECALPHVRFEFLRSGGISVALRRLLHVVGIEVERVHHEGIGCTGCHLVLHLLRILYVQVLVAHIGYGVHGVLPGSRVVVVQVVDSHVDKPGGFVGGAARQAANAEVHLLGRNRNALAVVKQSVVVVGDVAAQRPDGVADTYIVLVLVAFVGQQVVVGVSAAPV